MERRIRIANRRHLALLTQLYSACHRETGEHVDEERLSRNLSTFIDDPRGRAWISTDGDQVIGFASTSLTFQVESGWTINLEMLYVVPEARHQGQARALLDEAYSWGREQDATEVRLFCAYGEAASGVASLFPKHVGFREAGVVILSNGLR